MIEHTSFGRIVELFFSVIHENLTSECKNTTKR